MGRRRRSSEPWCQRSMWSQSRTRRDCKVSRRLGKDRRAPVPPPPSNHTNPPLKSRPGQAQAVFHGCGAIACTAGVRSHASPPVARHDVLRTVRDDCRRNHPRGVRVGPAVALDESQTNRLAAPAPIQLLANRLPQLDQASVPLVVAKPCDMGLGDVKKFGVAASRYMYRR